VSGKRKYTDAEVIAAYEKGGKQIVGGARVLGCSHSTMADYLHRAGIDTSARAKREPVAEADVTLPEFPDDDISVDEIREMMVKRFEKRQSYQKAKDWFSIKVNIKGPIGVTFWGDPHVDDDGCNWPLLNHHCDIHRANKALFSVNIGDTINNWADRLAKLYANQETSLKTAKKLAEWFLKDSGIRWICWLAGNHDLWTDFTDYLRAQNVARIPMEDWQARFKLVFPNGREAKIWAAHNFAGHSQFNTLHGPQKAAHSKAEADIYASGHTHNWAIHQEESASRDFTYWLIRSRGYKYIDDYALKLGHFPQAEGASITCVINPDAESQSGFIQAFADMDVASDYLAWLRR
jgi:hypothetical protein